MDSDPRQSFLRRLRDRLHGRPQPREPALTSSELEALVADLKDALENSDFEVRQGAILEAGDLKADARPLLPALLAQLVDTGDEAKEKMRRMSADAIFRIDPSAAALTGARATPELRQGAEWALERIPPQTASAVPALIRALENTHWANTRSLDTALARVGAPAVPALEALLRIPPVDDAADELIRKALGALEELGPQSLPALPTLVEVALVGNDRLGFPVTQVIAAIDGPPATRALLHIIADGHGRRARGYALDALARIKATNAQEVLPWIIHALLDASVRMKAVGTLRRLGSGAIEAAPQLLDLLETEEPVDDIYSDSFELHREIASALGAMGREVLPLLLGRASHKKPLVRISIANAIGTIGHDAHDAEPYLVGMLSDSSQEVREAALQALAFVLRPNESAPILVGMLDRNDEFVNTIVRALAYSPAATAAVPYLLDALTSRTQPVVQRVFEVLRLLGTNAVAALIQRMSSAPHYRLAQQVLETLADELDRIPGVAPAPGGNYAIAYSRLTDDELDRLLRANSDLLDTLREDGERFERRPIVMRFMGPTREEQIETVRSMVKHRQAVLREIASALSPRDRLAQDAQSSEAIAVSVTDEPAPRKPKEEVDRYTDVAVYEGHFYSSEDLTDVMPLPDKDPLIPGCEYTLEVAIRRIRRGISAEEAAPRPTKNPRRAEEEVRIYVLATALWEGIEFEEEFSSLTWPHDADSDSALFRFTTAADGTSTSQGPIEIRLYDVSLDLLDIVRVCCTVTTRDMPGIPKRTLLWPDVAPAIIASDSADLERYLSIHVREIRGGYRFEFLVRTPKQEVVRIPIVRDIKEGDLEQLLVAVRDFWTRLVVTNYEQALTVTNATFELHLGTLRKLGLRAWTLLFGSRSADQTGGSETLGEVLTALEGKDGACIQVTHANRLTSFVFPWSILYPPSDAATLDPMHFWGAKYQIEQVTSGRRQDKLSDEPVEMAFVLDPSFGNSSAHAQLMRDYKTTMSGRFTVTDPISDQAALVSALTKPSPAHLFYFFCHGYTASRHSSLRFDGIKALRSAIEEVPPGSAERRALDTLLTLTERMKDESWIFMGNSEIKESQLRAPMFFATKRRPLVFLNMCQSAELVPSLSSGFVRVFLEKNACAVVGTESPMTAVFAHEFARETVGRLLNGASIGAALWEARRHFLSPQFRNPLGLAYTLYGRAGSRLGSAPLATQ